MSSHESENTSLPIPIPLPSPTFGKNVTILSIDGGGIRGLIPAVILRRLEAELQFLSKDENVRIADFFDVIAGVSTGGLISAMLATPDSNQRPLFTAEQVVQFYKDEAANIFNEDEAAIIQTESRTQQEVENEVMNTNGPKYKGLYLRHIIQNNLNDTKLEDALTELVIPTFDIKKIVPTIFSTYKLNEAPQLNAKLSDICIATSAAPTFFPPHFFQTHDNLQEFHLTDGGLAALNPALAALSEVSQSKKENPEMFPMMENPNDYKNIVLISLGCGIFDSKKEYDAQEAAKWGRGAWVLKIIQLIPPLYETPLLDFLHEANCNMTEYHLATLFNGLDAKDHYLRVQDNTLTPEMYLMDNADPENLRNLEQFAEELLIKPVKRINVHTFELQDQPQEEADPKELKQQRMLYPLAPGIHKGHRRMEKHHRLAGVSATW
ncbi:patatin-like protein 2 [Senna tora]|uniref:Patatin n=1 Tax=Senna tora TaxID=362788 RepID=A0A835CJ00_9FABA|nr:patatin-like protein 2 [Senna tora]